MMDNMKIIRRAIWMNNASKEMYHQLSNELNKLTKIYPNIPKIVISNLNFCYVTSKKLFFEGKRLLEKNNSDGNISPLVIDSINKRYIYRSIPYLLDAYNQLLSISSLCNSGTLFVEIKNDMKLLLNQNKSVADLLRYLA